MVPSLFSRAFIGLWHKSILLRPRRPLRCLSNLWRAFRAWFARKSSDQKPRGGGLAKLAVNRQLDSAEGAVVSASRMPPRSSGFINTTSAHAELLNRPASITNDFSPARVDLSVDSEAESEALDGRAADSLPSTHARFKDKIIYPTLEIDRYGRKICLCAQGNPLLANIA